jgi:hypothetical protein
LRDAHFPVDATLVKARASMKSIQPKAEGAPPHDDGPGDPPGHDTPTKDQSTQHDPETDAMPRPNHQNRNAEVGLRGGKRSSVTHASTTDPDARLCKKSPGTGAMLCFMGHALMENRCGLMLQGDLIQADGGGQAAGGGHHPSPFSGIDPVADAGCGQRLRHRRVRHRSAQGLRDRACRTEIAPFSDRRPDHPTRGLCPVDQAPQADRRGLRLGQDHRRNGAERLSWCRKGAVPLHPDDACQQPRPTAPVARSMRMKTGSGQSQTHGQRQITQCPPSHREGNRSSPMTNPAPC